MARIRVRAPELRGRRWLNTGGAPLKLADLRGKIVLLDFWTSGCVNCLHVLDELRDLEERYADVLVTIGVHSPKFAHEADPDFVVLELELGDVALFEEAEQPPELFEIKVLVHGAGRF